MVIVFISPHVGFIYSRISGTKALLGRCGTQLCGVRPSLNGSSAEDDLFRPVASCFVPRCEPSVYLLYPCIMKSKRAGGLGWAGVYADDFGQFPNPKSRLSET